MNFIYKRIAFEVLHIAEFLKMYAGKDLKFFSFLNDACD